MVVGVNPFDCGSPAVSASVAINSTRVPVGTDVTSILPVEVSLGGSDGFAFEELDGAMLAFEAG